MNTIVPPKLEKGDRIRIIAPAGNIKSLERFYKGVELLENMGFSVINQDQKWPGTGFLANDDNSRLREFHAAWECQDTRAIIALRGGYGSLRLLDSLDFNQIRSNPKIFLGFSDITLLLNLIHKETGVICFHGPVLSSIPNIDRKSLERLYYCLTGNWHTSLKENIEVIRPGETVSGTLVGGNLSSLVTLLGTKMNLEYQGKILLIEDVNEPFYRLDRLLTQLKLNNVFTLVKGIILGDFSFDNTSDELENQRMNEFAWQRVAELVTDERIPIWGKFPVGHQRTNITLPIGASCKMDSKSGKLIFDRHT